MVIRWGSDGAKVRVRCQIKFSHLFLESIILSLDGFELVIGLNHLHLGEEKGEEEGEKSEEEGGGRVRRKVWRRVRRVRRRVRRLRRRVTVPIFLSFCSLCSLSLSSCTSPASWALVR